MTPREFRLCMLLILILPALAAAGPVHSSIGVCTRKEEFAKRQAKLDPLVAELATEERESKRKKVRRKLVKAAEKDIECLIRYREPALVPVLAEIIETSKRWYTRTRALYALKMLGDEKGVPAAIDALGDREEIVREAAAACLGHLGGAAAGEALAGRLEIEKNTHVRATIEAALVLAAAEDRPYDEFKGGVSWTEKLVGPEHAKRVEWAWTVKGKKLFNAYDAQSLELPTAKEFVYPILRYEEDLFAGYPRNSFGAGGRHAGEDCAWFREGSGMYAIADGIVRMVQGAGGDWGFLVVIEHRLENGDYLSAVYGHMAFDILVEPGEIVRKGQRIGSQGLSTSVENGGYGSHLHFGLGAGPFRRPAGMAIGDKVNLDLGGGKRVAAPILRFGYSDEKKNSFGFPLTTMTLRRPDNSEQVAVIPEQHITKEIAWFQAYVKDCRGWLNPQEHLPRLVGEGR